MLLFWLIVRASDGIQIHENSSGIHRFYSEDNRIMKVIKAKDKALIVADEMGSVKLNI